MKTIYPISAAIPGGTLHTLDYELRMNSALQFSKVDNNIEITGNIPLTIGQAVQILDAGGEVEQYLMAIKGPLATLEADVPVSMPDNTKPSTSGPVNRKFNDWLAPNNVWTTETDFWFLSQTVAGTYLKASEIYALYLTGLVTDVRITSDPDFVAAQNA